MTSKAPRQIIRRFKRLVTGPDEHGSTYVYFGAKRTKSAKTVSHPGEVLLDYDTKGRLIGIELLSVPWRLGEGVPEFGSPADRERRLDDYLFDLQKKADARNARKAREALKKTK